MPQYLLSVHHDYDAPPMPDDLAQQSYAQTGIVNDEMQSAGVWVFAGGLHPPTTATVVDGLGTDVVMTDGPFTESKEHIGGFWIITAPDLDAALAWAAKASAACREKVEVRPFQDG